MADSSTVIGVFDTNRPEAMDIARVIQRAEELLAERDPRAARELVLAAVSTFGRAADLLWILADAEFADGDLPAGLDIMEEALARRPPDAASVAHQIRLLRANGFWRQALTVVTELPAELRAEPEVRAEAGMFFAACECPAHAALMFGVPSGLSRQARRVRRWSWLRSGGPSGALRRKALSREDAALQDLRRPPAYLSGISRVDGLDARQVRRIQAHLETSSFRYARWWSRWFALHRAGYRLIPMAVVPVWLVLLAIASGAGFPPGMLDIQAFAAVAAVVAMTPVAAVVWYVLEPAGRFRRVLSVSQAIAILVIVVAVETAAGEGYAHRLLPDGGWPGAAMLGLMTGPAAVACLLVASGVANLIWFRQSRRIIREDPLLPALDSLLLVFHDLSSSRDYWGMRERRYHCRHLEWAARCITQYVISPSVNSLSSSDWLTRRAAGWAEAIQQVQRQIIAPVPSGSKKVEGFLIHEIRCLASGNLGALSWREPPPEPSHRMTLRRRLISAVRAVTVAILPLAAVLVTQPFLHVSSEFFDWARIATGIWALLCILLSIDPAIRDKIGAARDLTDLVRPASAPSDPGR